MNCPNCNKEVQSDWKGCPYCEVELKEEKKCSSCGRPLDSDWKTCPFCSEKVCDSENQQENPKESDGPEKDVYRVLGVKIECPHCNEPLYHENKGSYVDCQECGLDFSTGADGKPIGVSIECPHCDESLYHEENDQQVTCQGCGGEFFTGSDGKPTGISIECPHCNMMSYYDDPGLVDCPECGGEFTVDKN